jgi:hypothetical protein
MSACPMCRMRPCRCFMGRQAKTLAQAKPPKLTAQPTTNALVDTMNQDHTDQEGATPQTVGCASRTISIH